jgi:diaminohydroxyphosphoribosylaminopyrimidine deaminase/5-amino-6-(5-phosphoribosylamino)uracil reductase
MNRDQFFMLRALELAKLGIGYVSPNPRVGCLIVHENKIIGEGWHKQYGKPHAEVNAIDSVEDKSLLSQATAYVSLEPCSHHGKTPPCADLFISKNIRRVVVAIEDPNPLVAGKGISKLRGEGVEVEVGVLSKEAEELNKRFFTFIKNQRPYIILKWAQTNDGFIAPIDREPIWISNEYSRQLVHKWRTVEDAILIGSETALRDNPQLNVRDWSGRNPVRIVIDRNLKLPPTLNVFNGSLKTICYNVSQNAELNNVHFVCVDENSFLNNVLHDLYLKNIQSVIVEGGATLLSLIIDANLWDEARIFYAPLSFQKGIEAPVLYGKTITKENLGEDWLEIMEPIH